MGHLAIRHLQDVGFRGSGGVPLMSRAGPAGFFYRDPSHTLSQALSPGLAQPGPGWAGPGQEIVTVCVRGGLLGTSVIE